MARESRPLGLIELAQKLDMPQSTIHRTLTSLVAAKWVEQSKERSQYQLNEHMMAVSARSLAQSPLVQYGRSVLSKLSEVTRFNSYLSVLDGRRTVALASAHGELGHVYDFQVGLTHPAHASAGGKLIIAHLDQQERFSLLHDVELRRYTPQTLTTFAELERDFEKIRAQGYGIDDREHLDYWRGISAPVRNSEGRIIAAITVGGSIEYVTEGTLTSLRQEAMPLAFELSRFLGADED